MQDNYSKLHNVGIFLLCLYLIILPIDSALGNLIGKISMINYIALAYALVRLAEIILINKKLYIKNLKNNKIILLYLGYYFISLLWIKGAQFNRFFILSMLFSFIVYFLSMTNKYTDEDIKKLYKSLLFGIISVLFALIFLADYHTFNGRLVFNASRTMDPNFFTIGLCIITSLLFNNIINKRKTLLNLICLIFIFLVIALTGSRGGLIANFIVIIFSFLFSSASVGKKIKVISILVVFFSIFFALTVKLLPSNVLNRYSVEYTVKDNGAGRSNIWSKALKSYSNSKSFYIVFGTGAASFQYAIPDNYSASHNVFIQTLIECGLIGSILFISLCIKTIINLIKNHNYILLCSFVGIIFGCLTVDFNESRTFWICLFLSNYSINFSKLNYEK